MGEIEYAQDYLIQAIYCLENDEEHKNSIDLVELYISLADMLRKSGNIDQSI